MILRPGDRSRKFREDLRALAALVPEDSMPFPEFAPPPPRKPVRRRPAWLKRLRYWDDHRLQGIFFETTLPQIFAWPTPPDVRRLQREGGNPYLDFWLAASPPVSPNDIFRLGTGIAPMFRDTAKLRAAFRLPADVDEPTKDERLLLSRLRRDDDPPEVQTFIDVSLDVHPVSDTFAGVATHIARDYASAFYSWAVPDPTALRLIADLKMPVLEIGSGRGYWAWQLERAGVRIVGEDPGEYKWYWKPPLRRTHRALPSDHALFFCWPSHSAHWPYHRLREYQGSTVIYIGEWGGSTADARFHHHLEKYFWLETRYAIPQWRCFNDRLYILRRL